ncbi:MAG TPA: hypothetical protein PKO16_07995, partial [Bacteroidia bacterium]|nr:hypothetical protein [Bacteroidia bacterium]
GFAYSMGFKKLFMVFFATSALNCSSHRFREGLISETCIPKRSVPVKRKATDIFSFPLKNSTTELIVKTRQRNNIKKT